MEYQPPKCVKDFIKDISDLLRSLVLRHDQIVIVVDESRPLVKDFLAFIDS